MASYPMPTDSYGASDFRLSWREVGVACRVDMNSRQRTYELQTSPTKALSRMEVPVLRACLRCRTLIINHEGCKYVTCQCGATFCFACLQPWDECNTDHSGPCAAPVAPRQG
ncbi:unnamed protein product [Closterium sp. Naga37s-1]|nr:unnamed protein product [Closterium sp. Naga37s-1]